MAVSRHGDRKDPLGASQEYAPGPRGWFQAASSILTGMGITARHASRPPVTVRYPLERVKLSARWRGALRLRGTLGRDETPLLTSAPPAYNAMIQGLVREDRLPPCVGNCPANVDARGQGSHIADDRAADAYELVRERNILPGVLGRICHHPCESACRRGYYDEPLAVRPLHRFASEEFAKVRPERIKPLPRTREQTIGIVGAGPSGLAAAFDLMRLGYGVVVYEKEEKPGGALYSGVPSYRLPREVLFAEIEDLVGMGMDLRLGVEVGRDVETAALLHEHAAVIVALGLQTSRILPLPGTEAEGVMGALPFLRAANWTGDAGVRGKRVLVIGGGNVAVDVARCALRVGAVEVRLSCLESDSEMPCHPWEIEEALDEGVVAMCSLGPEAVLEEDGKVVGMRVRECVSVFDETGRFSPVFGEERTDIPCDVVVFSIGQASEVQGVVEGTDIAVNERGQLVVDGSLFTTSVPNVFACGEVVTGPGSAIGSIATGHEVAESVHRFLTGEDLSEGRVARPVPVNVKYEPVMMEGIESERRRLQLPLARAEERCKDFSPVEFGFTRVEALREAARCLRCHSEVCMGCGFCERTCPDYAIQVERLDDPGARTLTRYEFDMAKCCFCGLCAEQCPTDALAHSGQYELTFFHRDLMVLDRSEMLRDPSGTRATGRDAVPSPESKEASL